MGISASVTNNQITATVGETQIDVAVSGGVGPTGSSGTVAVSAPITNAGSSTAAVIGLSTGTGLAVSGGSLVVSYGTTSTVACRGDDARLSDSREWSADTVGQVEAEAGTSTTRRAFTPLRVFQSIAAWWAGSAAKTKLDGIATGATANQTDAYLLARANHTGTQPAATISDFTTAVIAAAPPTTNASLLTSGTLAIARIPTGTTSTTVALGNHTHGNFTADGRLADTNWWAAQWPVIIGETGELSGGYIDFAYINGAAASSHAHGNITNAGAIGSTSGQIVVTTTSGVLTTAASLSWSLIASTPTTLAGYGITDAVASSDSRLTNARTPTAHKSSHATGGSDALSPADIGAAALSHTHSASDITSGTVAAARLGSGTASASNFLRGDGTWATAGSSSASDLTSGTLDAARLPIATANAIGAVRIGSGISIDGNGVISASAGYTLPAATISTLGGVIVGTGLGVSSGTVSVTYGTSSGTACQGNDSRLSDSRIPTAHASTHQTGGSDAVANVVQSPSQITGNQNDYAPSAGDIIRISSDAARTITGLTAAASGDVRVLVNVGSFAITLAHQSASSTAANRFLVSFGSDYIIAANAAATLIYDGTTSRWRVV